MSVVLLISVLLRLAGTVWAVVLMRRVRDARIAFFGVMLALMAARQLAALVSTVREAPDGVGITFGPVSEIPGLAVSVLGLVAVGFLGRFVQDCRMREEWHRSSESLLRSVLESSPDFVTSCDPDGTFRWVNRMQPGMSQDDVIGHNLLEFVQEADRPRVRQHLERVARHGETVTYEVQAVDGVGGDWYETQIAPIRDGESVVGMVLSARKVTDRKHLEQMLERTHRLDALGTLAGGVAHDFNNLLTAILGSASAARSGLEALDDGPERRRLTASLDRVQAAAERASGLTRQLLAFGRRHAGEIRVVAVNTLIESVEDLLRGVAGEAIELSVRLDPAAPNVEIDPTHLEQIVLNLVVNARDAIRDGGTIVVETLEADVDVSYVEQNPESSVGRKAVLRVNDDGEGMDEATLGRVFDPFYTTKPDGHSSGLGLASVYGLVRQAGGHVEVDSRPGHGTTFRVFLPASDRPADMDERSATTEVAALGATILLCEDDELVRDVAREMLESNGFEVLAAGHPDEAIEIHRANIGRIDLVVTDVVMPGMDGRQLAERLTSSDPGLRVLFVSGYAPDTVALDDDTVAVSSFLAKPFTPSTLLERVRELLAQGR